MRTYVAALACAGLVAGAACGNVTTREERLAARGIATEAGPAETFEPAAGTAAEFVPVGDDLAGPAGDSPATGATPGASRAVPSASARSSAASGGARRAAASRPGAAPVAAGSAPAAPGGQPGADAAPTATPSAAAPEQGAVAPATPKSEIVFGSFGVEAGPLGTISGPAPVAIRAWVADVNRRGGLNGHPVKVILADDGGDPARAQAIVRGMVEDDGVVAMFYPYAIGTLVPVLPYLEGKGIPVLGQMGAETRADYSEAVFQPFIAADKGTAWGFLLGITAQTDKRKLGILWCREVVACQLVKDGIRKTAPEAGAEVVYDAQISLAQPDYTAEVLGAQRSGVDVLVTFADVASVNRVAQSAHRQQYFPVLSATHNMQHSDINAYTDELDGLVTYSRIPPYDSPRMADYVRAMRTFQPKAPLGELGASAWVMGKLLEAKVAPRLDDDPSAAEITEAMYSLRGETLGGLLPPITFPRKADRSEVNLCVIAVTLEGGRFVPADPSESFLCAPGWKPGG